MRTIKFRGWDKKYKYMNYKVVIGNSDETDKNNTSHAMWIEPEKVDYKCEPHWCNFDENSAVFMQYTGLKDKNGTEIYEGDILKSNGNTFLVIYKEYGFHWQQIYDSWLEKNVYNREERSWLSSVFVMGREVAGNIYENPELIEED